MATGDVPAQSPHSAANALWIFDGNFGGPRPATRTPYVSWPPPGYVPYQVAFVGWSFAYPGANFSNAVVVMRSNNVAMSVSLETLHTGSGENALVWQPVNFFTSKPAADIVYSVTVSNVLISGGSSNFSYNVTVFDPATLGPDSYPPIISGPGQPAVGQNNPYNFTAVSNATSYEWRQMFQAPYNLVDGAETGLGNFAVSAATNLYALIVTDIVASGTHAFHLTMPNFQDQILTLTNSLYVASNSVLTFKSRLTFATTNQIARVQASHDEGATWTDLYSQPGTGGSGEGSFATHTLPLDSLAGQTARLRFNYSYNGGLVFNQTNSGFGWYLDDITLTNVDQLVASVITATAGTNFMFNPGQPGNYQLNVRGFIYGEFPLEWSPTKLVTAISPGAAVRLVQPVINNNQVVLDFSLISGSPGLFTLEYLDTLPGVWNPDAAAVLTTNVPGASYRFTTVTNGTVERFYRVHVQ